MWLWWARLPHTILCKCRLLETWRMWVRLETWLMWVRMQHAIIYKCRLLETWLMWLWWVRMKVDDADDDDAADYFDESWWWWQWWQFLMMMMKVHDDDDESSWWWWWNFMMMMMVMVTMMMNVCDDDCYLVMKVILLKEVMSCDVSPMAMFYMPKLSWAYLILVTNAANGVCGKFFQVSLVRGIFWQLMRKVPKYSSPPV